CRKHEAKKCPHFFWRCLHPTDLPLINKRHDVVSRCVNWKIRYPLGGGKMMPGYFPALPQLRVWPSRTLYKAAQPAGCSTCKKPTRQRKQITSGFETLSPTEGAQNGLRLLGPAYCQQWLGLVHKPLHQHHAKPQVPKFGETQPVGRLADTNDLAIHDPTTLRARNHRYRAPV